MCGKNIKADIVGGNEIYPWRPDLYDKKFARCPVCEEYTGVYAGESITIPTPTIRQDRFTAHAFLDRIWNDKTEKARYYKFMSKAFKRDFHWGEIRTDNESIKALEKTADFFGITLEDMVNEANERKKR